MRGGDLRSAVLPLPGLRPRPHLLRGLSTGRAARDAEGVFAAVLEEPQGAPEDRRAREPTPRPSKC